MDPVLQAALQRAQTPSDALIYVLIAGLLGLGGLITFAIRSILPRIVSGFDRVVLAVEGIPTAIRNIESTLVATEGRIGDRISALGARIETKIDDGRITAIQEELRRREGPASQRECKPPA